ncbi:phosphomethylpyrimidine synthase ThiC [Candidatus Peregrinibacteria bacterium]|nr:phosphomethylpyrimidine synthase ThiC [Candidatus Peregrinibacteria bacterium]
MTTQLTKARKGIVTPEMEIVSQKESCDIQILRKNIASGKVIIPANHEHIRLGISPTGIGKGLSTKVNANIGASPHSVDHTAEMKKLEFCEKYGADTFMDLSTAGNIESLLRAFVEKTGLPLGTVPLYQVVKEKGRADFDISDILRVIEAQAKIGVDFITVHAGFRREFLPFLSGRVTGVVSRGGGITKRWMEFHGRENPLFEAFDDILEICRKHDVSLSLGDSLRPGSLADCGDKAQMAELACLGELTERAWKQGVQVMIEGPGHVPIHHIQGQMEIEKKLCHEAPVYVLGPLVIDTGAGYDHITGAIGGAVAGMYGADMLCYVTPAEHLSLPNSDDVREGLIAFKIAARAADIAKEIPGAMEREKDMSVHRKALRWEAQSRRVFDREKFYRYRMGSGYKGAACSMCGDEFCPMKE